MKKFLVALMIILAATAVGYSEQVSLKITGGMTWINGGDYNLGVADQNRLLRDTSSGLTGAYQPLSHGLQGQIEISNSIGPHFAVGLGGGYFRVSRSDSVSGLMLAPVSNSFASTFTTQVSVIPIFLNLHYLTRIASRLSVDVYAGPIFYVVQFNFENPRTFSFLSIQDTVTFTASQTAWGGQGGLGLAYQIFPGVSLVADGSYRFGTVTDFQGNFAELGTSSLGPVNVSSAVSYMWFYQLTQGATYDQFAFADSTPVGGQISEARHAKIDLSGLSLSAGFKFSF